LGGAPWRPPWCARQPGHYAHVGAVKFSPIFAFLNILSKKHILIKKYNTSRLRVIAGINAINKIVNVFFSSEYWIDFPGDIPIAFSRVRTASTADGVRY
jgi:hypothetical protein